MPYPEKKQFCSTSFTLRLADDRSDLKKKLSRYRFEHGRVDLDEVSGIPMSCHPPQFYNLSRNVLWMSESLRFKTLDTV
jgi:hypothetical protein